MATRALLIHAVINATDRPSNINIAASQQVGVYEMDGATLLEQPMYATQTGGAPIPNPLTSNSSGMVVAYADLAQSVIVKVNGVAFTTAFSPWPQLPFWYEDVRAHGASTTASPSANRAAIQGAIDTVVARGGGSVFLPELYHISGASISVVCPGGGKSVVLEGVGRQKSGLIQDSSSVDVLTIGAVDPDSASGDAHAVRNMTLEGGRYNLHLIDSINGEYRSLNLIGGRVGVLAEGQVESSQFDYIQCSGQTEQCLYLGYDNAVSVFAEAQKVTFNRIKLQPATTGNAIKIRGRAGSPSGNLHFIGTTIEIGGGQATLIDIDFTAGTTTFDGLTNESALPLSATNTASVMSLGTHTGDVVMRSSLLAGGNSGGGSTTWKYGIEQHGGRLFVENTGFSSQVPFGTAAIYVGTGLQASGCTLTNGAAVVWQDANARSHSLMGLNYDGVGNVIAGYSGSVPFVTGNAYPSGGVLLPQQIQFGEQNKASMIGQASIAASSGVVLLGDATLMGLFLLSDDATGMSALFTCNGRANTTSEIADPGNIIVMSDTGADWAAFWDGGSSTYRLRNKGGSGRSYRLIQLQQLA